MHLKQQRLELWESPPISQHQAGRAAARTGPGQEEAPAHSSEMLSTSSPKPCKEVKFPEMLVTEGTLPHERRVKETRPCQAARGQGGRREVSGLREPRPCSVVKGALKDRGASQCSLLAAGCPRSPPLCLGVPAALGAQNGESSDKKMKPQPLLCSFSESSQCV